MPVAALWGVAGPAAQAMMTHQVDPREQGRLQGAVASLSSIAGIIAPTLFTRTFAAVTEAHVHNAWVGITFALAGAMVGMAWLLAWFATSKLSIAIAAPPPESIVGSEILASTAELQPPIDETQSRA